jgi:hypothetical protein
MVHKYLASFLYLKCFVLYENLYLNFALAFKIDFIGNFV